MNYMFLIYGSDAGWASLSEAEQGAVFADYGRVTEEMRDRGVFVAGDPLEPIATATTVRVRNGERLVTDGPFAETKEQLGGYYILDCANVDEAIEWAAKIPGSRHGSIEVRPVMPVGAEARA